jgi:hypothetical protein
MEYGRVITILTDAGNSYVFNAEDENGDVFLASEFQNMDAPTLRTTSENRPGKPGTFEWPGLDAGHVPGIQGTITAGTPERSFNMEQSLRKLHREMRSRWATMSWTNSDGVEREMRVAAVGLTIQGTIPKNFLLQMRSDQGHKDGDSEHTLIIAEGDTESFLNDGDMETWMTGRLYGPWGLARLTCVETGDFLELSGTIAIDAGSFVEFDMLNETLYRGGDQFDYVGGFLTDVGDFFSAPSGSCNMTFTSDDAGSAYLTWRDAWS